MMSELAQIIKIEDKVFFNVRRREIDIFVITFRGVILMDRIELSKHIKKVIHYILLIPIQKGLDLR